MPEPKILLATHNQHKVAEIREILAAALPGFSPTMLISAADLEIPEPVEDATSFAGNALIKAGEAARAAGIPALADDSGIRVDILGGAPGIFSARWSGKHGADRENLELLLAQLADVPEGSRGANFTCTAALALPDGRWKTCSGQIYGSLGFALAGTNGFGYDPIFVPQGAQRTLAEMTPEEKNRISHRRAAFQRIAPWVGKALGLTSIS